VEKTYPILHVGPTVGVVPFVDASHVLLIRQFRHLLRGDSWELPGGGGRPEETPEVAAQRELREEGGYRAGRLTFLTRFVPSAAYLDETAYCFIGEELVADPLASDDDEFFERRVIPFREAVAMALDDRITESVSKVALLAAALRLGVRP
jgi:ADP-ribose pyrophosphatase